MSYKKGKKFKMKVIIAAAGTGGAHCKRKDFGGFACQCAGDAPGRGKENWRHGAVR